MQKKQLRLFLLVCACVMALTTFFSLPGFTKVASAHTAMPADGHGRGNCATQLVQVHTKASANYIDLKNQLKPFASLTMNVDFTCSDGDSLDQPSVQVNTYIVPGAILFLQIKCETPVKLHDGFVRQDEVYQVAYKSTCTSGLPDGVPGVGGTTFDTWQLQLSTIIYSNGFYDYTGDLY